MARLIDADVLRDYWHISEQCESCHWNNIDCSKPPYYPLRDICEAIDEAPTIDAIPVEWLNDIKVVQSFDHGRFIDWLVQTWQKEQEAR